MRIKFKLIYDSLECVGEKRIRSEWFKKNLTPLFSYLFNSFQRITFRTREIIVVNCALEISETKRKVIFKNSFIYRSVC